MNRIIQFKPYYFILAAIGIIPLIAVVLRGIWLLFGESGTSLTVVLFLSGFIGFYLFWLFTISYGLDLLNIESKIPSRSIKNRRTMIILLFAFLLRVIFALPPLAKLNPIIIHGIDFLVGIIGLFALSYLFYNITEDYIFHTKNRMPGLFDYFLVLFHFAFYPFGLLMLHNHIRKLMSDKNILNMNSITTTNKK